jgi:hypothetical protein
MPANATAGDRTALMQWIWKLAEAALKAEFHKAAVN